MDKHTRVINFIASHEGFRGDVYLDTLGYPTIGYGQKLCDLQYNELPECYKSFPEMPKTIAREWLTHHVNDDYEWAQGKFPWFVALTPTRTTVVLSMIYQLGRQGFIGFTNTIIALQKRDYETAAEEMLDSKWAKQTPNRAAESAYMMKKNRNSWERIKYI